MRSERERKHARERGLAHVRNLGVAESLRLPLPTQRGETVRVTYMSMGACAHARGRFPRKSRAEKPGFRRREPSRVELGSSRLRCPVWPSELPHVAIWGLRCKVRVLGLRKWGLGLAGKIPGLQPPTNSRCAFHKEPGFRLFVVLIPKPDLLLGLAQNGNKSGPFCWY